MRRSLFLLLLILLFAACGSATETDEATNTGSDEAAPAATSGTETKEETNDQDTAQTGPGAVTTGSNPQEASIIREQDHVKGAEEPTVTIIEYGDFQ